MFVFNFYINVSQLLDEKKIKATDNLFKDFETPEKANKMYVMLKDLLKYDNVMLMLWFMHFTALTFGVCSVCISLACKVQTVVNYDLYDNNYCFLAACLFARWTQN